MSELLALQSWSHGPLSTTVARSSSPSRPTTANTSATTTTTTTTTTNTLSTPQRFVSKAKSSNALSDIAGTRKSNATLAPTPSLNTLPDPRLSRMTSSPELTKSGTSTPHHPDLSDEVATLSDKLIRAINHQTTLDDALSAAKQELDSAREKVQSLEMEAQRHEEEVADGIWVKRAEIEEENLRLKSEIEEERRLRQAIEKDKKNIEQELENLTAALFEEANQMVAAASKEREATERKNEQLRAQVKDTESLLASHQEQLAELKLVMQQLTSDRDEIDSHTNGSTAPSSPAIRTSQEGMGRLMEVMNSSPATSASGELLPAPSLSYTQLVKPACRTDIKSFEDFTALLQIAKQSKPSSRVPSGSYAGLNIMSLPGLGLNSGVNTSNASVSNGAHNHLVSPSDGSTPGTPIGGMSPRDFQPPTIPLKETKFYKRILTEDIEPTLRLDIAPGVSWLTRRAFLNSICEGGLVVEPMPSTPRLYLYSCALCGEVRKGDINPRTHRFRTSDNETAQRHPLCVLCLEKVRASCDLVGYLKVLKDGHVRVDDTDEEKDVWEETIRLRERLFWARIGGGVVPAFLENKHMNTEKREEKEPAASVSASTSDDEGAASTKDSDTSQETSVTEQATEKQEPPTPNESTLQPPSESKFSIGKRLMSRLSYGSLRGGRTDFEPKEREPAIDEASPSDVSAQEDSQSARPAASTQDSQSSLKVQIPGAFA